MYCIHLYISKYGCHEDYDTWFRYSHEDFENILSHMNNLKEGYIIGDLNMSSSY